MSGKKRTEEEDLEHGKALNIAQNKLKTQEKVRYKLNLFLSYLSQIIMNNPTSELIVVNKVTGEEIGSVGEIIPERAYKQIKAMRRKKGKLFEEMFVDCGLMDWLSRNAPQQSLRMINYFIAIMLPDNSIRKMSYSELTYQLNISKTTAIKAVKWLIAVDLVVKDKERTDMNIYYVNPLLARKKGMRAFYYIGSKFRTSSQPALERELSMYDGYEFE